MIGEGRLLTPCGIQDEARRTLRPGPPPSPSILVGEGPEGGCPSQSSLLDEEVKEAALSLLVGHPTLGGWRESASSLLVDEGRRTPATLLVDVGGWAVIPSE